MTLREPMSVDSVLVPVDGTEESTTAVEYAVAVADRYDASVHVLFVLGHGVLTGIDAGTVESDEVASYSREFLDEAAGIADGAGVPISTSTAHGFTPSRKTVHPGSVVLDTAEELAADFIVVPRESVQDSSAEVLEQVAEYVLSYASQPVLSV